MDLVLFALTGVGNEVLRALQQIGVRPLLVVSRREVGAYPYYEERQLAVEASGMGIPVLYDREGEEEAMRLAPDILLSATYHRLIPQRILAATRNAFNIHPSLLPAYPGKNPFFWTLINGETITGVTVHRLTQKFDAGDIVMQRSLEIFSEETQGSLRRKLARLSGEVTRHLIAVCDSGRLPSYPSLVTQVKPCGRVTEADRVLNLHGTLNALSRKVRALAPWPRAVLGQSGFEVVAVMEAEKRAPQPEKAGQVRFLDQSIAQIELVDATVTARIEAKVVSGQASS